MHTRIIYVDTWFENTAYQVEPSKHVSSQYTSGEDMHSKDTSVHSSHMVYRAYSLGSQAFVTSSIWLFLACKYGGAGNLWDI